MIRIILQTNDYGDSGHVGGPPHITVKTFDLEHPEIEEMLSKRQWEHTNVIGIQVIDKKDK